MREILIGDIRGNCCTLAYYRHLNYHYESVRKHSYKNKDYAELSDLLEHFIHLCPVSKLDVIALSIANQCRHNHYEITNLPWTICEKEIKRQFNIEQVILISNIESLGIGLLLAPTNDLIKINSKALFRQGHRAFIDIDRVLNEAYIFWDGKRHYPTSSEGGDSDFAPVIPGDIEFWDFLNKHYPGHLSYDCLLCESGLSLIYKFICQQHGCRDITPNENKLAWICDSALQGVDLISSKAIDMFTRLLAVEAANLCLKVSALGGIYITGSLASSIVPLLNQTKFLDAFVHQRRAANYLESLPIWICLNESALLDGTLWKAKELIAKRSKKKTNKL
jgi:glucokinase